MLIKFHKFVATNYVCESKKFNFRSGLIMILKKCRNSFVNTRVDD